MKSQLSLPLYPLVTYFTIRLIPAVQKNLALIISVPIAHKRMHCLTNFRKREGNANGIVAIVTFCKLTEQVVRTHCGYGDCKRKYPQTTR